MSKETISYTLGAAIASLTALIDCRRDALERRPAYRETSKAALWRLPLAVEAAKSKLSSFGHELVRSGVADVEIHTDTNEPAGAFVGWLGERVGIESSERLLKWIDALNTAEGELLGALEEREQATTERTAITQRGAA